MPAKPRRTDTSESSPPAAADAAPKAHVLRLVPRQHGLRAPRAGASSHPAQAGARLAPPAPDLGSGLAGDLTAGDRDLLLSAVKTRLRLAASAPAGAMTAAKRREMAAHVRASLLDCVQALERLHLMLTADADRIRQLKLDAFDALDAPAVARAVARDERAGRRSAMPDPLTLLPNRSAFLGRLRQAFGQARLQPEQFAVLTFQLDGFKTIHVSLGSDAGDELLGIVASRLLRAVRRDDMLCRLRGDQFGLFIESVTSREQLRRLIRKLFDALAAPIAIGTLEVGVRPNIGVAMSLTDGASAAVLVESAGTALAHARRQKTGFAFYDERGRGWVPGRV